MFCMYNFEGTGGRKEESCILPYLCNKNLLSLNVTEINVTLIIINILM